MRTIVASIEAEYRRYKKYAEGAIRQLGDEQLAAAPAGSNSVATIVWHIAGNLKSRFTDFLTTDGEKPWRNRESEFLQRHVTHAEALAKWEDGWRAVFDALGDLDDEHLEESVTIRNVSLTVLEALHRSLAHTAYHVGQIVFLARSLCGEQWQFLSIPPGQSEEYRKNPTLEKPPK